jgi:hypothetical protein
MHLASNAPESEGIPGDIRLTRLQKLLVLRVFYLNRVREDLRVFVPDSLGLRVLESGKGFRDLSPLSSLIFIIAPGIDPEDEIIGVATSLGRGCG